MVARGLAADQAAARELITNQRVLVSGSVALNPARQVGAGEPVVLVAPPPRFVSRAGLKLEAALDRFDIDVVGRSALDVGSSTGGFTDCLLSLGAKHVNAVDVGTNQMREGLKTDARVTLRERTDIRAVERSQLPTDCDLVTVDVSFISVATLASTLVGLSGPQGELVVLVKPQFEATRQEADRSAGVIADVNIWRRTIIGVADAFEVAGAGMMGVMASPLRGTSGNVEFLIHLRVGTPEPSPIVVAGMYDAAIDEVV